MAWEWSFTSPYQDALDSDFVKQRKQQAQELRTFFSQNNIAENLAGISQQYGYLPRDVQVGAAMVGLTKESPEFTSIIESYLDKERSWWEGVKAATRGAVRGAFVGMESASQFVKRYGTAGMRYYSKKQQNPLLFFSGIGTAAALINPDYYNEVKNVFKETGPTLAGRAFKEISKGNRVNLGEGYFGNSTLAEDTEVYKELVGRGADAEQVREIIQEQLGTPLSQQTIDDRERAAMSYSGRRGTVKLSPGRVAAVEIFEPGTKAFKFMSGLIDGAYTIFTDPSTYFGMGLSRAGKVARTYNPTVVNQGGLINKAVRATVHQPTAKEFINSRVGTDIADLLAKTTTYDEVEIILKKNAREMNDGALLMRNLRDTKDTETIKKLLIDAIEDDLKFNTRLDANSLLFKGKFSRAAAKAFYGPDVSAVGFKTAMKLRNQNSKWNRLFQEFPAPKLHANDLNQTFFELKDWMKFAKVDDDVAFKALDDIANSIDDEVLDNIAKAGMKSGDPRPAKLANVVRVLEVLGGENGVLPHIEKKFMALELPPELVKGMRKFMTSVDETRKYFRGAFGEEWFQGQKLDVLDNFGNDVLSLQLNLDEALKVVEKIASNAGIKKSVMGNMNKILKTAKEDLSKRVNDSPGTGNTSAGWAQFADDGFEVSTAGDDFGKQFSAFNAKFLDGDSVELKWAKAKGYDSIEQAKRNPAVDSDGRPLENFNYYPEYKKIWNAWADENPDLIEQLAIKAQGKKLTDKFANTNNNQARALSEIINERFGKQKIKDIKAEGNPIAMNNKVKNRDNIIYNKDTTTLDMIMSGKRTHTTRTLAGYGSLAPRVGQIRLMQDKNTGRQVMVRITGINKLPDDLFVNPELEDLARELAKKEGYTFEFYQTAISGKLQRQKQNRLRGSLKPENEMVGVEYELASPTNIVKDLDNVASIGGLKDEFLEMVEPAATIDRLTPEMDIVVKEINSGGQTGVDLNALEIASDLGIATGGKGMPGLTVADQIMGRYDHQQGQLMKYNVQDTTEDILMDLKNDLSNLMHRIAKHNEGVNFKSTFDESRLTPAEIAAYKAIQQKPFDQMSKIEVDRLRAIEIKAKGGFINQTLSKDAKKSIDEYIKKFKTGAEGGLLYKQYKLEDEIADLTKEIKLRKEQALKKGVISVNATDEEIQEVLKNGELAISALQKLNVKLEGKNFRGQTQDGKRIRERAIPSKELEGLLEEGKDLDQTILDLQDKASIFNFIENPRISYYLGTEPGVPLSRKGVKVKEYKFGEADLGIAPDEDKAKLAEKAGYTLSKEDLRQPSKRVIEYDDFDIDGYVESVEEGGLYIASLQAKKLKNVNELNRIREVMKYKGKDADRYLTLTDEIRKLETGDIGSMKPDARYYAKRTSMNVDNTDATIVLFSKKNILQDIGTAKTILYASRGKWVGANWKAEITKNIDKYKTGVFAKTLNKPLIIIDMDNPTLTDEFIEQAQKLLKGKKVNVAGPRKFTDKESIERVLRPLLVKSKVPFTKKKAGKKLLKESKVTPQQILDFFQEKVQDQSLMNDIANSLFEEANIQNIARVKGRPTAQLVAEYLASDAIPMPDARLFLRVFSPAREFWLRAAGKGKMIPQRLPGLQEDEFISSQFEKELAKPLNRLYELTTMEDKKVSQTAELFVRNARKQFKLTKNEEEGVVRELTAGYLGLLGDSFMNKAWKPAILLRAAWTSRVVGEEQMRMWMDNLDNVFSHPLSAFAWIMGKDKRRLFNEVRGYGDEEVAERLIAKGVYDIMGDTLGDSLEAQSSLTKSHGGVLDPEGLSRKWSFEEVSINDDKFIPGAASELLQLSDDPLTAEIAYRLTGFNGTFRGQIIEQKQFTPQKVKNNPNKIFVFGDNIAGTGKGGQAVIRGNPNIIGIPTKHSPRKFFTDDDYEVAVEAIDKALAEIDDARGLGKVIVLPKDGIGTGRAGPKDPKTGKYTGLEKQAPKINAYLQKKLKELKAEKTDAVLDDVMSAEDAIQSIKDDFWQGPLDSWRRAMTYGTDETAKYQKSKMLTDRAAADAYIEGLVARLHYKTGGHYKTYEEFSDGSRKLLNDSQAPTPADSRSTFESIIRHEITFPGDDELIRHVAFGKKVQAAREGVPKGEPALLRLGVKKDGTIDYVTWGRGQTIDDHAKYKKWLRAKNKNEKTYDVGHVMKKSIHDMNAERINRYDQVIESMFTAFMAVPTNRLSRSSAFRQYYWRFIEENGAFYDNALKDEIIERANMQASRWVKNAGSTAKKLKSTRQIKTEDGRVLGIENIAELDEAAKAYALTETKRLLYDLNKRHVVSDMLRLAFPFAEVYQEIIGTWGRLINQQKLLAGRKVQRVITGARNTNEEGEEGFFHTDEMSGEEMFFFPGTELLTNWMFGEDENRIINNPTTGQPMEAPDVRVKLEGYASSLNMVAGNPVPGLGPLVAIPAGKLLPDTELIDKLFFPYGREEGSALSPYTFLEQTIPSWLKKLLAMGSASSPDMKRTYANTYKDVLKMLITTGLYDDSTKAKQQDAMNKAKDIANRMTWIRAAVQFAAPTGAVVRYEIETTPGGALYLDPAEFKENDPDGYYFGMSIFADAYYRILAKYKGDQLAATTEFVNQFGIDPSALLTSKSKEITKRSYTEEGGRFTRSNSEVLQRYPNIGYYIFPDNPLDEFDFNSWSQSFADRDRVDLSEDEYVATIRNAQGRLAYEYQRRMLFDTPQFANVPSQQKFEMLTALRNSLRQEYPGYGTTSTVPTSMDVDSKIREFQDMIAQDGSTKVKLPNGQSLEIQDLPAVRGAIEYLEARDRLLSEARLVLGSNVSLQREQLSGARAELRRLSQELFAKYPDFYYVYLDLFKYEVEEQYTDVTFYGGNS